MYTFAISHRQFVQQCSIWIRIFDRLALRLFFIFLQEYFARKNRILSEEIKDEMQHFTNRLRNELYSTSEPARVLQRFYIAKANALDEVSD